MERKRTVLALLVVVSGLFIASLLVLPRPRQSQVSSTPRAPQEAQKLLVSLPLSFVENRGQWDPKIKFVTRKSGVLAAFEPDAISLKLAQRIDEDRVDGVMVRLTFEGASKSVQLAGEAKQPGRHHFFLGNDPARWHTDVPAYGAIHYRHLYDGIDVRVREQAGGGLLEYDLLMGPGADLKQVAIRVEGVEKLSLESDGTLLMHTARGLIPQHPPTSWYVGPFGQRQLVEARFCLLDATHYGFQVPESHRQLAMVIDPALDYSTYLGGFYWELGNDLAVESSGLITIAGWSASADFPVTPGAFSMPLPIQYGVVTKLDPNQTGAAQLIYSTALGSATRGSTNLLAVAVDPAGLITVAGRTSAGDFPTTSNAFDRQFNPPGPGDGVICRLDPSQTGAAQLVYSTFFGYLADDSIEDLVLLNPTLIAVTGNTFSSDFPRVGFQTFPSPPPPSSRDVFVSALDIAQPPISQLVFSTVLGGSGYETVNALALGSTGFVVVGSTPSSNFPAVGGAYQRLLNGPSDAFVANVPTSPRVVPYSTFLGGNGNDGAMGVAVDDAGVVTVVGSTTSTNFPTPCRLSSGCQPYDTSYGGGASDAFIARMQLSGTGVNDLLYATLMGGMGDDVAAAVADRSGRITVAGVTDSPDLLTTSGAYDPGYNGNVDLFVLRLQPDGRGLADLIYLTYLGSGGFDRMEPTALAIGDLGEVFVTGTSTSQGFPTTLGAYDRTYNPDTRGEQSTDFVVSLLYLGDTLRIDCTPQSTTISPGGQLVFDVTVTNQTSTQQFFRFKADAFKPNGAPFLRRNPIAESGPALLQPGQQWSSQITRNVPPGAPAPSGPYLIRCQASVDPDPRPLDVSRFEIQVVP